MNLKLKKACNVLKTLHAFYLYDNNYQFIHQESSYTMTVTSKKNKYMEVNYE